MLEIRELIRRVQLGETDRRIARDLQVSRKTVRKYRAWAQQHEVLAGPLPDSATLQAQLKTTLPVSTPPVTLSKVTPFRDQVAALRERGVECRAIFDTTRNVVMTESSSMRHLLQGINRSRVGIAEGISFSPETFCGRFVLHGVLARSLQFNPEALDLGETVPVFFDSRMVSHRRKMRGPGRYAGA